MNDQSTATSTSEFQQEYEGGPQRDPDELLRALFSSNRIADRALRRVERLQRQRRIMARHLLDKNDRLRLALRIIHNQESAYARLQDQTQVLRLAEEVQHLRQENQSLVSAAKERAQADLADLDATRNACFDLDASVRRLKSQRRILARELRRALVGKRRFESWIQEIGNAAFSPAYALGRGVQELLRPISRPVWRLTQRLILATLVGWRGSRQTLQAMEQIDG